MRGFRERFGRVLFFSAGSFLVLAIAEIVNYNRAAWLGIDPRSAPQNFSFNVSFYIPMMLASVVLALISIVYFIRSMWRLRRTESRPRVREWVTILPIAPILWYGVLFVLFIVRIVLGG